MEDLSWDGELPDELLIEIGRFATDWAVIEQEVVIHASALAAQDTGGAPVENLRTDFRRLREKWFKLAREKIGDTRRLSNLNSRLAVASKRRGYFLHGIWSLVGPGDYRAFWFEQKISLESFELLTTIREIRHQAAMLRRLRNDLGAYSRGLQN